jgi:membrane carboxypeptidase/penicillin-binding protein PbpC
MKFFGRFAGEVERNFKLCETVLNNHTESKFNQIDPVFLYVACLEDRRYFCHRGYDLLSILRALGVYLIGGRGGGASTIEQQLVRTITGQKDKNIQRKIKEILVSRRISSSFDKVTILNTYLELAYFGHDLVGVDDACTRLVSKRRNDLSPSEAALVASLLLYPRPRRESLVWREKLMRRAAYARAIEHAALQCLCLGKWAFRIGIRPILLSRALYNLADEQSVFRSVHVPTLNVE